MKMSSCFRNSLCLRGRNSHGEQEGGIVIGSHVHPFSYHEQNRRGRKYECNGCQEPGYGPYYSCTSDSCNFHYHKCCGDILRLHAPPVSNHHPYPVGRYIFTERTPSKVRYCVACGDQVRGLRYKVRRGLLSHLNNLTLHPLCASLPSRMQDPSELRVTLVLQERIQGECPICKGKAKGWAYNSACGNYCYHVGCVRNKFIQNCQDGGTNGAMTIRVETRTPQILKLAAVAIRLIIGVLFGVPDVADICILPFT